ncbi:acetate--CoA ligase family protein [Thermodesulfobacteriota bacterium]
MSLNNSLRPFFKPKSIMLVGARRSVGFGYGLPLRFKEDGWGDCVYLVNPKGGEMHGLTVYKTVAEVSEPVELAIVIVPAPAVPETLTQLGERGIGHVIILSAGFSETGDEGKRLQQEAAKVAGSYGIRIIGPNCVGILNTENRLATTSVMPEAYTPGKLAVIAQSGAFGHNLLTQFNKAGIFISKAVTLGNRMDVNESEILDYLHQDRATELVVMYLEGAADGRRLVGALKRITPDKPVLVLKGGRTAVGRQATISHTGSLSGADDIYEAMFRQTGATRVENLLELVELAKVFSSQPLPRGNRLGILTVSGSMGVLAADTAIRSGLTVPPLAEETCKKLREGAPDWMTVGNPADVGPSNQFPLGSEALLEDPNIDMVLAIIATPYAVVRRIQEEGPLMDYYFRDLNSLREKARAKPFLIAVVSHDDLVSTLSKDLEPGIPVFNSPEMPVKALAALWRLSHWREQNK